MLDEERGQRYLIGGGINLRSQYPWCAGCRHHFFDGPSENATVGKQNLEDVTNYMQDAAQELDVWACDSPYHVLAARDHSG